METADGIAAIAILGSLLDTLVRKNVLTQDEARETVVAAYDRVGITTDRPSTFEATRIIGNIVQRFA